MNIYIFQPFQPNLFFRRWSISVREHLSHLKFIVTFFVGNTALLRTNHSEHHDSSCCLFLPLSVQRRKNVKAWHLTMVMCSGLRRGRWTTSLFWKEKEAEGLWRWGWTPQRWGCQSGLEDIYWPWACPWLLAAMFSAPQLCPPRMLCIHALSLAERFRKVLTDTLPFIFTHHGEHSHKK